MAAINVSALRRAANRLDAGPHAVVSRAVLRDIVAALTGEKPVQLVDGPAEPPAEAIRQAKILNAIAGTLELRA